MTAECLACDNGQSVSEFCNLHPQTKGCPGQFRMWMNIIEKNLLFIEFKQNIFGFNYILFTSI